MTYQCERDIDAIRGPYEPCAERATERVWLHYAGEPTTAEQPYYRPERYRELGRYCPGCGAALIADWQRYDVEIIVTPTNRCPQVRRDLLRIRDRS